MSKDSLDEAIQKGINPLTAFGGVAAETGQGGGKPDGGYDVKGVDDIKMQPPAPDLPKGQPQ